VHISIPISVYATTSKNFHWKILLELVIDTEFRSKLLLGDLSDNGTCSRYCTNSRNDYLLRHNPQQSWLVLTFDMTEVGSVI